LDKLKHGKIYEYKKGSYLDDMIKLKKDVPTPTAYEVAGSLVNPKKGNLSKGPRITVQSQIE
jgi:hypothetical protein